MQTGVGSGRRLLAGEITGRRCKNLQGLRAAPGAVIDQAEELQRYAVVRDRLQDAARDPLRLRQIAALIERSQKVEQGIDHRINRARPARRSS
ncbi:MAG TPA: hypothetical protein PLL14_10480, partial [Accumulibacter sp.]|nr:hypothetical protein [Accumulibacter sp.]